MRNFEGWCLETCHYLLRSVVEEGATRVVSGEPTIFPPFCPHCHTCRIFVQLSPAGLVRPSVPLWSLECELISPTI